LAAATFANAGRYVRINVAVSASGERGLTDVTDVDVLSVSHDLTFKQNIIAASCKSGASVQVAHEIFYLRGVLDYMEGDEGLLLSERRAVPPPLRSQAGRLGITTYSGGEIAKWAKDVAKDSPTTGYFDPRLYEEYARDLANVLPGDALLPYLRSEFWYYRDYRNVLAVIGLFRRLQVRLDGRSRAHATVFLETAVHLCLALFDACRFVLGQGLDRIEEALAPYLFGGNAAYRARRDLLQTVGTLLSKTGTIEAAGPQLPPLEPAYIGQLAEVVLRFCERPQSAVMVPLVLQDALWKNLGAQGSQALTTGTKAIVANKLAGDLITFMRSACEHPWAPKI
jgi:hypothetical protein